MVICKGLFTLSPSSDGVSLMVLGFFINQMRMGYAETALMGLDMEF